MTQTLSKAQVPLTNAAVSVLLVRLFLAFEWLTSGTGKIQSILTSPGPYLGAFPNIFSSVWTKGNPYLFMIDFLTNTAAPNASKVVTITALCEILVGLSLLFGLLTRAGAFGGIVMNLIFYLAAGHTSPSTAGINLVMIGAQLAMVAAPGGRVLGLDAVLHRKFPSLLIW